MEEKIKGKTGMVVEYVIRDKDGKVKERGEEELNIGGKKEENGNISKCRSRK